MPVEREITSPVDLCLPDGRLDPAAVGWTRQPLHRASLRGWGRAKRWEYWGLVTPTHIVGLVAASLDYAATLGVYVLDRETGQEFVKDAVTPLARGVRMPDRSGAGTASGRGGGVSLEFVQRPEGTTISAEAPGFRLEAEVPAVAGHESLGVVVPFGQGRFQYTLKDLGRPVRGRLVLGEREVVIGSGSFAVLDHGRGKWPRSVTWNWAAGCAPGRAIQLGGQWTDGTGSTENAVFTEGRLHKISDDLTWEYDRTDWLKPWRITGPRVQAEFHPFHERVARSGLVVVSSETHQCFGTFSGRAQADDGTWVSLDGLTGWAEEARNRW
ncbi:Protein of unknown function [Lentzea fradiae]|uniref:Tocopherol cyclase n=1 Tax=Lentzea fradiae TaxID=200378 RepID=A0A1G7WDL1_9PSEU|nr:DUF2804 domain-containing protein [Lentzea fradiae]SDG70043.1 Protein of unknown function [Lentzea fradiae]